MSDKDSAELRKYDSLETNPIKSTGVAGEIEKILRGYETVANQDGPVGFDLQKDGRTEYGFYWEFDDIAEAAQKIAAHVARLEFDTLGRLIPNFDGAGTIGYEFDDESRISVDERMEQLKEQMEHVNE